MRENRTHGSEGGEAKAFPTPIRGGFRVAFFVGAGLDRERRRAQSLARVLLAQRFADRPAPTLGAWQRVGATFPTRDGRAYSAIQPAGIP